MHGTRVIDASTAYRTADGWVYGMAETRRPVRPGKIRDAQFRHQSRLLATGADRAFCARLIAAGLAPGRLSRSTFTGITGYSGGGKAMIADYEATRRRRAAIPALRADAVNHKHLPELKAYALLKRDPLMVPVVGDFAQGMVTMVPLQLGDLGQPADGRRPACRARRSLRRPRRFASIDVAPLEKLERTPALDPETMAGSDRMRLHVFANDDRAQAVLIAVYDNLGKGASGAAVQNLDIMIGG